MAVAGVNVKVISAYVCVLRISLLCVLITVALVKCVCSVSRCCIARDYCLMSLLKKNTPTHIQTQKHREDDKTLSLTIRNVLYC